MSDLLIEIEELDSDVQCRYCMYSENYPKDIACYGGEPVFPICAEREITDWFDVEAYSADKENGKV